jgi:hypothetical protein
MFAINVIDHRSGQALNVNKGTIIYEHGIGIFLSSELATFSNSLSFSPDS